MHADDQHLLVVGAVEDADLASFGQLLRGPPEEVVIQLRGAGVLEAVHLATLGIHAGHNGLDRAVLPRGVHALKDDQQRVSVRGVLQLLKRREALALVA